MTSQSNIPSKINPWAALNEPSSKLDTPESVRINNLPGQDLDVKQILKLPTASPTVSDGVGTIPFNTRQVYPFESTPDSATIDVFTGIQDTGRLTDVRDRAVYDRNTLSWSPIADSNTGVLFPDAVTAKTVVESSLRVRPTTFKGPKQLDVSYTETDQHFNRQINPNGWRSSDMPWYKNKGDLPFRGYPNPNYFNLYTDAIVTHSIQNLSHSQMVDAMRASAGGDFDNSLYLNTIGSLLRSDAVPEAAAANIKEVIQTDGGGVNSDPRILERIYGEYELDFNLAKRIRVADASNDPRFVESAPGTQYMEEQGQFQNAQETQFSKIQKFAGIPSGYMNPVAFHVG